MFANPYFLTYGGQRYPFLKKHGSLDERSLS